jgi:hypothetical protein
LRSVDDEYISRKRDNEKMSVVLFYRAVIEKHCIKFTYLSPGPFIGPVEIRGKKNKKNYISFLPPGPFIGPVEIRGKKNKKKYFFSPSCLLGG